MSGKAAAARARGRLRIPAPSRPSQASFCALAGVCFLAGCGPLPSNPVTALGSATFVYAFEPEQVFAYEVGSDGRVTPAVVSRFRVADGGWNMLAVDPFGRFMFGIADGASVLQSFQRDPETGALELAREGPSRPPPGYRYTAMAPSPSGRFLFAGADPAANWWGRVSVYRVDQATAALSEVAGSPSATAIGTHRLWPDPQGRFLYVSNAAKRPDGPECVSGYRVDAATGALTEIEGSPFKTEAFVNQMDFHPSGRFVYATAGHFLLAYQIAPSGALEPLPVPDEPVFEAAGTYVFSLVTSRDGRFLFAFQQSGWILSYRIDQDTGGLTFVGELRGTVGYVAWLLHPAGTLAFTLSASPPAIHVHRIDATRGLLTEVTSPAALEAGTTPETRGQRLWLDASGQALGVLVRRPPPSEEVLLCTYRAELTAGTLAPVACTRVGETGSPLVAVVNQAPAWRP